MTGVTVDLTKDDAAMTITASGDGWCAALNLVVAPLFKDGWQVGALTAVDEPCIHPGLFADFLGDRGPDATRRCPACNTDVKNRDL